MRTLRIDRRDFLPLCAFITGFSSMALASPDLDNSMNVMLRAADNNGGQGLSRDDCQQLKELSSESVSSELKRFNKVASEIVSTHCHRGAEDDSTQPQAAQPPVKVDLWDGKSRCLMDSQRVLQCEHNGASGRGLFVYSGSESYTNSPSLVCAHFAATGRSPFELYQEVDHRCVLTEFDWRYESSRSDVQGMKTWLKTEVAHSNLQIPASLAEQCQRVFPDALYCTPTLIVLRERNPDEVSICGLKTRAQLLGLLPLLRISSLNSRWACESKSLLSPDSDQRLSVEERSCVPDHLGRLMNNYCRLPYMPVARHPVRTFIP